MVILSLEPLLRPTAISKVIMEYADGLSFSHLQPKVHGQWLVVWRTALGPVTHLPQAPAPISFYPRVCLSVCLGTSIGPCCRHCLAHHTGLGSLEELNQRRGNIFCLFFRNLQQTTACEGIPVVFVCHWEQTCGLLEYFGPLYSSPVLPRHSLGASERLCDRV